MSRVSETKKFCLALNKMRKGFQPRMMVYRGKDGKVVSEESMMDRWAQYFEETLNRTHIEDINENEDEIQGQIENDVTNDVTDPPTIQEIVQVVKQMKNGKAPGEDAIMAEMIREGGQTLFESLHYLIGLIWREEVMPEEWRGGIIHPIFKGGDKMECQNYRGITLLNVVYKIFSAIIRNRLEPYSENILGEYQCGFCRDRGTTDQIFVINQIIEKFYEHGIDVHCLFIDFKQAFDSLIRPKLCQILKSFGILSKLVNLITMIMAATTAKVKMGNRLSRSFHFNAGVKQGDGLSAVLFNIALQKAIERVDQRGTIFNKLNKVVGACDEDE